MESNNSLEMLNSILIVYAIPFGLIFLAGIIVLIFGFVKEKKSFKIAGLIITVTGFKLLVLLGCMALYMKFIISMTNHI